MIIFPKERAGLPCSQEGNQEDPLQGCRLGWWVFKKGKGLAALKPLLMKNAKKRS